MNNESSAIRSTHLSKNATLLAFTGIVCLLLLLPVALQVKREYFGHFINRHAPNPQWIGLSFPFILAALMILVVYAGLSKSKEWADGERKFIVTLLALLVVLKFLLHHSAIVFLGEFAFAEAVFPFMHRLGDGAYALAASQIEDGGEFLGEFQERFLESERDPLTPHLETHPPGFILIFYGVQWLVDVFPGMGNWVEAQAVRASPILNETLAQASRETRLFRHALPTGVTVALLCFLAASLVPVGVYLLSREIAGRVASFVVASASALLPGWFSYNPGMDQFLGVPALLMMLFAVRAVNRKSAFYGILFGLAMFVSFMLTLAFLVPLGMLFWCAVFCMTISIRELKSDWKEILQQQIPAAVGALAGFLVPVVLFIALWDFNLLSVLMACQENNAKFHQEYSGNYIVWSIRNVFEAFYSMGAPVSLAWLAVVLARTKTAWTERSLRLSSPIFWGVNFCFLVLAISGVNRGEVARIWGFLFPVLIASLAIAFDSLDDLLKDESGERKKCLFALSVFFVLQALYVLIIRTNIDAQESAKFFYLIMGASS